MVGYSLYNWLFFYTLFATIMLISKVINIGDKKAKLSAVKSIDKNVDGKIEVIGPNQESEAQSTNEGDNE